MEEQDKTTFALDDGQDEIVEEEFVDRDEEYDEDDDEEYDDEEYDDEGDEEYDDEEYDDGYNDDYYDDRLNKVLDELAELKRGLATSTALQQPMPPQYVYQPSAPPAGSEVVMYNEISRLRDELAKNQSSLEMQKELTRIKEDMARDQKFTESQYNAELKRLQDKIDDLLKNASNPQGELPPANNEPARLEGGKSSLDFDKLISLNEAILRISKEGDARIVNEIGQIKKQLEEFPSADELSRAVSAVKKAAGNTDSLGTDALNKLSGDIEALRAVIGQSGVTSSGPVTIVKNGASDSTVNELLRQLYDIKNSLGNPSSASVKRTQTILDLIGDYKKASFDVHSQNTPFKDKLVSVFDFSKKLSECEESDAADLIDSANELIGELASTPLTRSAFADLAAFCQERDIGSVTTAMRDSAERYFGVCEKAVNADIGEIADYLPDLVAEKNVLQNNRCEGENEEDVAQLKEALNADPKDEGAIKASVAKLAALTVASVIDLPYVEAPKSYKPSKSIGDDSVFSKLAELKTALLDANSAATAADQEEAAGESALLQEVLLSIDDLSAKLQASTDTNSLSEALEELRNNYLNISTQLVDISEKIAQPQQQDDTTAAAGVSDEEKQAALDDLRYIRGKLEEHDAFIAQIEELRNDVLNIGSSIDMTAQFDALIGEMTAQLDKLYEDFSKVLIDSETNIINRINELPSAADAVEQAKTDILAETQAIKDTLFTVSDYVTSSALGEAIEQLRADLNAFTEQNAANVDAASLDRQRLLDDVAFLREQAELAIADAEQDAEADTYAAEADAEAEQDSQKLFEYLDDISARVAALTAVPEDVTAIKENVNTVLDAFAPITEQLNAIIDRLDAASAQSFTADETAAGADVQAAAVSDEELTEIKDGLNTLLDTLPLFPQADDLITARDNTYAILDSLAMMPQSEDLVVTRDNVIATLDAVNALTEIINSALDDGQLGGNTADSAVAEDVAAIREDISALVAALPEALAEDVAVLRDNTNTVLDSLATIAQSQEDVKFIRQKLEEPQDDDLSNIMQDIGLVLDKLEAYEQQSANDKQEIIDAVSGIREEIHISELDETISAAGIDDETRETLVTEIADIRERLANIEGVTNSINEVNGAALDGITAQLADLQAALENAGAVDTQEDGADDAVLRTLDEINEKLAALTETGASGNSAASVENLQNVVDELSVMLEKMDADRDYDTVEEILSLREDVKAARIVDQNDVSGELESIKNELAAISSGNILDEIRALRDDIAGFTPSGDGTSAPTDGELNLVLNEIVSLRDEVFALKDEVLNATAVPETESEDIVAEDASNDDINTILDEITALRADQSILTGNIDELRDMISRRTTLAAESDGETDPAAAASNELNVVLDEIINLKNDIDKIEETIGGDKLDTINAQVDEIRALIDEMRAGEAEPEAEQAEGVEATADLGAIAEQIENINATLNDIRLNQEAGGAPVSDEGLGATLTERFDALHGEIEDIKSTIAEIAAPQDFSQEIAELRAELDAVRAENEQLKQQSSDAVAEQLAELRDAIRDMALASAPVQTADGDTSYAALIDEIRELRAQVAQSQAPAASALDEDTVAALRDILAERSDIGGGELAEIRDEIAQLRSLTTIAAESGGAAEVAAIRDEIAELKELIASPDSLYGVAEDVTAIKADVQSLKDEPDLGIMNEILALRDEFQSLREQIEDVKRIAEQTDKDSDDSILGEVQSLRDQLFAISMANVNDSASGESNYESYNNLILDEIAGLREQVEAAGSSEDISGINDELAQLKATLEKREELYDILAERVDRLNNDATNNKILDELATMRTEIANQRDADLTTLNFMSEMAHLLERQNQYLTQNAGSKISDEIESLKAEIASSDAVAEEVAKLREVMTQSGNASDNESILNELAELREELSREKPSRQNEIILDEISRLRDEVTALAEREPRRDLGDAELSDSITDLKEHLNEIAGIVEPEKKPQQRKTGTRSTAKSGTGAKSGTTKSGTGAKRGRKPGRKRNADSAATTTATVTEPVAPPQDLEDKIGAEVSRLEAVDNGEMGLDPNAPTTSDAMEVADKLAKQVANKLIMEQLVEQLSDGGVSDERVEEILKDILPQEFKTIAETEESDKVRRLANQLVLNKLRSRLSGKNGDGEN
ncbi:MAG: hypothetical protein NC184_05920 [Roseburia sp.]|nr:hypothetical protein [Roseburia sp.]